MRDIIHRLIFAWRVSGAIGKARRYQCGICGGYAPNGTDIGCMNRFWAHKECALRILDESKDFYA